MQVSWPISLVSCPFWKKVYATVQVTHPPIHSPPFTPTTVAVLLSILFIYNFLSFPEMIGFCGYKNKLLSQKSNYPYWGAKQIQIKFLCLAFLLLLNALSLFFLLRPPSAFGLLAIDTEFQMRMSPPCPMGSAISLVRTFQYHSITQGAPSPDNQLQEPAESITQLATPCLPFCGCSSN